MILRQQHPPGTREKYNRFQSRIPVMKNITTKRRGGVWKSRRAGFLMKGLESASLILMTGVPPILRPSIIYKIIDRVF
jgi:hypothetical protein